MTEEAQTWIVDGPTFFVVGKHPFVTNSPTAAWESWLSWGKKPDLEVYHITDGGSVDYVTGINGGDEKGEIDDFHRNFVLEARISELEQKIAKKKAKIAALQLDSQ